MAAGDLLFRQPPAADAALLFGGEQAAALVEVTVSGVLPALAGTVVAIPNRDATLSATLPALSMAATLEYVSHAARPVESATAGQWQAAVSAEAGAATDYQRPLVCQQAAATPWEAAAVAQSSIATVTPGALVRARSSAALGHQEAIRVAGVALAAAHQIAEQIKLERASRFAGAETPRTQAVTAPHQDGLRDRRATRAAPWQAARRLYPQASQQHLVGNGNPLRVARASRYQEAIKPNGGQRVIVTPPVDPDACYTPDAHLLFVALASGSADLLFRCSAAPAPLTPIIIPVRRAYIVVNQTSLRRAVGNVEIDAADLAIAFDADSWVASFTASIPESARDAVMPDPAPVEVIATINGAPFHFLVEKISRSRAFGKRSLSIAGRGIAGELDAPYAPIAQHTNAGERTVQQLIADALQFTGYDLSWGITDWLVPAGLLSLSGPPIAVAQHVAEAAGAVLAAHWSQRTLRLLPRYPVKPWEWAAATPEYVIPGAVTQTESLEWLEYPGYNAVYVSGVQAGILGHVKIAGTAADIVAPMVTHPLITHADAARQRGLAILGNTGRKTRMQISLPVLPETGIIDVCKLVEFSDGANTRRGIVRANSIQANRPVLRQTLTIEATA